MPEVVLPLTVRDLTTDDPPAVTSWAGLGPREAPERMQRGEVDYLVVCPPSGVPVALGGAIYNEIPGAGTLWQLSVHPALRSCGIGTILVGALEQRIHARGLRRAELGVDEPNVRARALYERLGYVAYGRDSSTWDRVADDGSSVTVTMTYTLMRKELPSH